MFKKIIIFFKLSKSLTFNINIGILIYYFIGSVQRNLFWTIDNYMYYNINLLKAKPTVVLLHFHFYIVVSIYTDMSTIFGLNVIDFISR